MLCLAFGDLRSVWLLFLDTLGNMHESMSFVWRSMICLGLANDTPCLLCIVAAVEKRLNDVKGSSTCFVLLANTRTCHCRYFVTAWQDLLRYMLSSFSFYHTRSS